MVPGVNTEGGIFRKESPQVELYRKVQAQAQGTKLSTEGWIRVEGELLGKREKKSRNKVEENRTRPRDEKKPNLLVTQ